jgi:hypothetical protein
LIVIKGDFHAQISLFVFCRWRQLPTAHAMKPGLWEITTQMSGGGMPAMPAMSDAQRKQMEAMGIKMPGAAGGPMTTVKHCVTKEQAEKRQPPQTDEDRRQRCEQKDVKTSGNT